MSTTLGEKMRQAREERGISISEVAEQTRISPLYLQSIENDNYKPLPGGIFNKGFLKSYARFIGYDEHEALQEYSQMVAEASQSPEEEFRSYRPEVLTDERSMSSILPTVMFAGIILALMTGGILIVLYYLRNQPETSPAVLTNANANVGNQGNVSSETTQPSDGSAPSMQNLRVEFKTSSEPIWVSSISDGKSSVQTITPEKPAVFEPRQALRLAYSKSLAAAATLTLNGREINLPQSPANPKRAAIEIEVNGSNLAGIWQNGNIEALNPQAGAPAATRPAVKPAASPAANTAAKPIVPANAAVPRSTPH